MECSLCLDKFNDPRVLSCGHTFCFRCLQKVVSSSEPNLFCSLCRKEWTIPNVGLHALPKNYVVETHSNAIPSTIDCALANNGRTHGTAEYFCIDCWDALCASCSDGHRLTKFTQNHVIKPIKEVSRDDVEQHNKQLSAKCLHHPSREVDVYCKICSEVACTLCCVTKHSKHDCVELSQADVSFVKKINNALEACKEIEKTTQQDTRKLTITYEDLKKRRATAADQIMSMTAELRTKIMTACDVIMQRINEVEIIALERVAIFLEHRFNEEFKRYAQLENTIALHKAVCESLLSSSSTVLDRASRLEETSQIPTPLASQLLQENIEEQVNAIIAIAKTQFEFKSTDYQSPTKLHRCFNILPKKMGVKNTKVNYMSVHALENKIVCVHDRVVYLITYDSTSCINIERLGMQDAESAEFDADGGIILHTLNRNGAFFITLSQEGNVIGRIYNQSSNNKLPSDFCAAGKSKTFIAADHSVYRLWKNQKSGYEQICETEGQCFRVVRVNESPICCNDVNIDSFWVIELMNEFKRFSRGDCESAWPAPKKTGSISLLSVYSLLSDDTNATGRKIHRPSSRTVIDDTSRVSALSDLTYDHNDTVMMSDYYNHSIHLYSVSKKQYIGLLPLMPSPDGLHYPSGLHFDSIHSMLYIGMAESTCIKIGLYKCKADDKDGVGQHCFDMNVVI